MHIKCELEYCLVKSTFFQKKTLSSLKEDINSRQEYGFLVQFISMNNKGLNMWQRPMSRCNKCFRTDPADESVSQTALYYDRRIA